MSGTYPASPIFASVGFKSVYYNLSSQSLSGRTQVRNIGGQRFEFSASYSRLLRSEFTPVLAFVMSQRGMAETFSIVLPEISSTSGTATGTVRTNGTSPIGDKTIAVDGFTGLLKAGDVIKFASHSKVYMVTQDRSGAGDLSIEPGLEAVVANDTVITYNDVPFLVRLNNDIQEYNIGSASLVDFDVDFIESV
mgnify:FL=1|tara:strand:- start:476 stop:1054 length:579 start_codon:yes stop_codon:yes gene_type:complete